MSAAVLRVSVAGGFEDAFRVASLLRSRAYRVVDLSIATRDSSAQSQVSCTVVVTAAECRLLLERLRRLPAVLTAEVA